MRQDEVLASLVELAERTGLRVRFERFDRVIQGDKGGGLCVVRGQPTVLLDTSASPIDQIGVLAATLAKEGIVALYVPRALTARRTRSGRQST